MQLPPGTALDPWRRGCARRRRRPAGRSAAAPTPTPRFAQSIERFTQFLTLVGLTALIVGGWGGSGRTPSRFVERKSGSIATLKSIGAPGSTVVGLYLTQVMLIAGLGTLIGLAAGASLPFLVDALFADSLPCP